MGSLDGRTALVFGVANRHSLAWGIAEALHREGARVGIVHRRAERGSKTRALAAAIAAPFVGDCDVTDDAAISRVVRRARDALGPKLDVLVHSIARAEVADLEGRFVATSRSGFRSALEVSAYSLVALAAATEDWLAAPIGLAGPTGPESATDPAPGRTGGSIVTLTAIGSTRVIPHYNVMGVAKAALEASVRYLAADLGPRGIRVNAISAGAVRTAAAVTVPGFRETYRESERVAPLRRSVTRADVGAVAAWLASDAARMVTGQVIQVDAGWSVLALTGGRETP